MSEKTASSLYKEQLQSKDDPKPADKHKTKFCLMCDTQYCSANDNSRSNWGDTTKFNFNDVKLFCTILDLPDVHTHEKIPLCSVCNMLIMKLVDYKDQIQGIQCQYDKLQVQLSTRAIKTCRKYNYNDIRPVHSTVQHIRRNIYRRWNRDIGDTSLPISALFLSGNADPPILEPVRSESRRKSRLYPRSANTITINSTGSLAANSNHVSGSNVGLKRRIETVPLKAQIGYSADAKIEENFGQNVDPADDIEAEEHNGNEKSFQLDEISIIGVQSGSKADVGEINYFDVEDEVAPQGLEEQETQQETNTSQSLNEETPKTPEAPSESKVIQINHSIFEDNSEDLNISNILNVKIEEGPSESESEHTAQNNTSGSTDDSKTSKRKSSSVPYTVTSPRMGARKRKPTLRAVESSEIMNIMSKRRRKVPPERQEIVRTNEPEPEPELPEVIEEVPTTYATNSRSNSLTEMDSHGHFLCETCPKYFKNKERYKEHMDMHSGQAPVCLICNKTFPRKYNLNIHMRTHTGEKPHNCQICGQAYADKSNLNAHLRKHVDKPYNCLVCRKMYEQRIQAVKHVEAIHPEESVDDVITTSRQFYTEGDIEEAAEDDDEDEVDIDIDYDLDVND